MKNEILSKLNKEQIQAVKTTQGPVLVIAGAGTGKTSVLTARIAFLVSQLNVSPDRILAFTFTNKAAEEMRERIKKTAPDAKFDWIRTYHSTCLMILKHDFQYLTGEKRNKNFSIIDSQDQIALCKRILKDKEVKTDIRAKKFAQIIQCIKADDISVEKSNWSKLQTAFELSSFEDVKLVVEIYKTYEEKIINNNQCDFEDLINLVLKLFKDNEKIRIKWMNKFEYILVDEFQDTNKKQFAILKMLINKKHNVFAVGDQNQTIFTFNGAYAKIFDDFCDMFENTKVIKLNQNYRSSENILLGANSLIANNNCRFNNPLKPNNKNKEPITVYKTTGLFAEAKYIAGVIKNAKLFGKDIKYSDFAVLYRTNSCSRVIEEILIQNSIPYIVYGSINFYQRMEIKDLISYIKTIYQPDDTSIQRIINVPKRSIGLASIKAISQDAQINGITFWDEINDIENKQFRPAMKTKINNFLAEINQLKADVERSGIENIVDTIVEKIGYFEYLKTLEGEFEEKQQNIKELSKSIKSFFKKHPTMTIIDFLNEITLYTSAETTKEDKKDSVFLMTVHMAKGKEFNNVFCFDFNETVIPNQKALMEPNGLAEERRIAYVAITRAKERLFITCSEEDMFLKSGWGDRLSPSRFIRELGNYKLIEK